MSVAVVLAAGLALTVLLAGMSALGGLVAAGLMPGVLITARDRIEIYVSSVACLALTGQVWLSAAQG